MLFCGWIQSVDKETLVKKDENRKFENPDSELQYCTSWTKKIDGEGSENKCYPNIGK